MTELLSHFDGYNLSIIQNKILKKYPQLEKYLDCLDDTEFIIYFETRYNVIFKECITYFMSVLQGGN
jgi:hypothetical protein